MGIIFNSHQEVLIAKRPPHKYCPGLWEFPGGKIEPNETPFESLKRELLEEIGIDVVSANAWFQLQYTYPDRHVELNMWFVTQFSGEPKGAEGQEILWCPILNLAQFQFPEGNKEIVKRLFNERC